MKNKEIQEYTQHSRGLRLVSLALELFWVDFNCLHHGCCMAREPLDLIATFVLLGWNDHISKFNCLQISCKTVLYYWLANAHFITFNGSYSVTLELDKHKNVCPGWSMTDKCLVQDRNSWTISSTYKLNEPGYQANLRCMLEFFFFLLFVRGCAHQT